MKFYFIADTHFSEKSIILYENRPFESVEKMDQTLIRNWNEVVQEDDAVYVLGDFGASLCEKSVLDKLNGVKYLVKGNHDTQPNEYYRQAGFTEVYDHPIVWKEYWILSHEPIYVNVNMPYANLFGHVHNSPLFKDYSKQHFCVSAERIKYTPIDFETIQRKITEP